MRENKKFIIIITFIILLIILFVLLFILKIYQNQSIPENTSANVEIGKSLENETRKKTIQEIIEDSDSIYISEEKKVIREVYVEFKYDLFDENGKSRKAFFYNIIDQIETLGIGTFRIKDDNKNIEIYDIYDYKTEKYTVYINGVENYFDTVDGEMYNKLSNSKKIEYSNMVIDNNLIKKIASNSSRYQNTELITDEKEELENGYCSFQDGTILAKLQKGKVLNIIFKPGYKEKFTLEGIYVGTPLSEIIEKYSKNSFGSVREGYLGYITEYGYIFFYENEVSVYPYVKKDNEYFDEYIINYCKSGNLENLISDFTVGWSSYFENESDLENGNFKISYPLRGIQIDIKNNDSKGIVLYNNYILSQDIKDLIIGNMITLKENENLVDVTEKARHESM